MDTTVGYVLLGSALVPAAFGYAISRQGLKDVEPELAQAKNTHQATTQALAESQAITAAAEGVPAQALAAANKQVAERASSLASAIGSVEEALGSMTGPFAPARVYLSLTLLLVVASLFPLGVLSLSTS